MIKLKNEKKLKNISHPYRISDVGELVDNFQRKAGLTDSNPEITEKHVRKESSEIEVNRDFLNLFCKSFGFLRRFFRTHSRLPSAKSRANLLG